MVAGPLLDLGLQPDGAGPQPAQRIRKVGSPYEPVRPWPADAEDFRYLGDSHDLRPIGAITGHAAERNRAVWNGLQTYRRRANL
jgi:hypothetical protein